MSRLSTGVLAAAVILLGGCQTTFDLVGVEKPLSAGEARSYDGSYQGSIRQVASNDAKCPSEHGEKVVMVGDGVLWYAYDATTYLTAPVQYDGVISAKSGATVMAGAIEGNHLTMDIKSPSCETTLDMSYIYNHS